MRTKNANVINPIQPMYNPTQADQERQRSMMMGQQQRKPKKMMGTAPAMGMSEGGQLKDVPVGKVWVNYLQQYETKWASRTEAA